MVRHVVRLVRRLGRDDEVFAYVERGRERVWVATRPLDADGSVGAVRFVADHRDVRDGVVDLVVGLVGCCSCNKTKHIESEEKVHPNVIEIVMVKVHGLEFPMLLACVDAALQRVLHTRRGCEY